MSQRKNSCCLCGRKEEEHDNDPVMEGHIMTWNEEIARAMGEIRVQDLLRAGDLTKIREEGLIVFESIKNYEERVKKLKEEGILDARTENLERWIKYKKLYLSAFD